jgi:hypothetical protein
MKDKDAVDMMRRCSEEIKVLRRTIEHLSPLADAYESIRTVLKLFPDGRPHGSAEDLAWRLDREIASLESAEPAETEARQ